MKPDEEGVKMKCDLVRQTAYDIHAYHSHGHLEKVYENALAHRLRKAGLEVQQQCPVKVYDDDGTLIGDYLADLLVGGWLIIELKAVKAIAPEHEAQILGYLKSSGLEHGMLINFGAWKFEIRKYIWTEDSSKRRWKFPECRSLCSPRLDDEFLTTESTKNAKSEGDDCILLCSLCSLRSLRFDLGFPTARGIKNTEAEEPPFDGGVRASHADGEGSQGTGGERMFLG